MIVTVNNGCRIARGAHWDMGQWNGRILSALVTALVVLPLVRYPNTISLRACDLQIQLVFPVLHSSLRPLRRNVQLILLI